VSKRPLLMAVAPGPLTHRWASTGGRRALDATPGCAPPSSVDEFLSRKRAKRVRQSASVRIAQTSRCPKVQNGLQTLTRPVPKIHATLSKVRPCGASVLGLGRADHHPATCHRRDVLPSKEPRVVLTHPSRTRIPHPVSCNCVPRCIWSVPHVWSSLGCHCLVMCAVELGFSLLGSVHSGYAGPNCLSL